MLVRPSIKHAHHVPHNTHIIQTHYHTRDTTFLSTKLTLYHLYLKNNNMYGNK